jgi:hypothetical protein
MYEIGQTEEAVKLMHTVLRRQPGYADLHVALAADAWSKRDAKTAEQVSDSVELCHCATVYTVPMLYLDVTACSSAVCEHCMAILHSYVAVGLTGCTDHGSPI